MPIDHHLTHFSIAATGRAFVFLLVVSMIALPHDAQSKGGGGGGGAAAGAAAGSAGAMSSGASSSSGSSGVGSASAPSSGASPNSAGAAAPASGGATNSAPGRVAKPTSNGLQNNHSSLNSKNNVSNYVNNDRERRSRRSYNGAHGWSGGLGYGETGCLQGAPSSGAGGPDLDNDNSTLEKDRVYQAKQDARRANLSGAQTTKTYARSSGQKAL